MSYMSVGVTFDCELQLPLHPSRFKQMLRASVQKQSVRLQSDPTRWDPVALTDKNPIRSDQFCASSSLVDLGRRTQSAV